MFQSVVFYTAYFLFSLVYIPAAAAVTLVMAPFITRKTTLRITRWFIHGYGAGTVRLGFPWVRFQVENRSGLVAGEPCLFFANHQSIGDPYLWALVPQEVVFISNHWPFRIPVLGIFARIAGYLNAQSLAPEELCQQARQRIDDGTSLVCFPEGTRTRTGELGAFHTTGFRLALQLGVPIIPFCISGLFQIARPGSSLLRPGTVHIHLLPAIYANDYGDLTAHQLKRKVRDLIVSELSTIEAAPACN